MQEGSDNILDVLQARFDTSEALEMLRYIQSVRHVFQFSLNPEHDVIRWDQQAMLSEADDAFTFTMKGVMRKLCQRQAGFANGSPHPSCSHKGPMATAEYQE